MLVNLSKSDLVCLVKGTAPYYDIFDHPLVKRCGSYTGGHVEEWNWNREFDEDITEQELWELYLECKNSWVK